MSKMNVICLIGLFLGLQTQAFASLHCGTENQWSIKKASGWFLTLDFDNRSAAVRKMESATVVRQYAYDLSLNDSAQVLLTSGYGDSITLQEVGPLKYAVTYRNEVMKSESFAVECFDSNTVSLLPYSQSNTLKNLLVVKHLLEFMGATKLEEIDHLALSFKVTSEISFPLLAQVIDEGIVEWGDWETTILNPKQVKLVERGAGLNSYYAEDFKSLMNLVKQDLQNNPGLELAGYLFGRDWYNGNGTIGIVLRVGEELVVVPFNFSGDAKFGDRRLDYLSK